MALQDRRSLVSRVSSIEVKFSRAMTTTPSGQSCCMIYARNLFHFIDVVARSRFNSLKIVRGNILKLSIETRLSKSISQPRKRNPSVLLNCAPACVKILPRTCLLSIIWMKFQIMAQTPAIIIMRNRLTICLPVGEFAMAISLRSQSVGPFCTLHANDRE